MQHLILSLLAKKLIFLENHKRGIKNGVASIGRSSRRASQVRRCTFASTAATPLLPAPAPVPRVLALLILPPRPPCTRPGTGAHTRVAQHELHSKCQPHPAAVHHKPHALAGLVGQTLVSLARPLASRSVPPPQRAAPCTAHRSHKTSRDKHRTCTALAHALHPAPT